MCADSNTTKDQPTAFEDRINLLNYLVIFARHRRLILLLPLVVGVLTCGLVLMLPDIYLSTARVVPPQDKSSDLNSALNAAGGLTALVAGVPGTSADLHVALLNSQTIADRMIDRFDLMQVYEQDYRTKTYEALTEHVRISAEAESGVITISVEDEIPARAAEIANAFIEELQMLSLRLNITSASRERSSLQKRIMVAEQDLALAENNLKAFQMKHQTVVLEDEVGATITAMAHIKAEIVTREVELSTRRSYQTEQHPEVLALKETIKQLKAQLSKLAGFGDEAQADGSMLTTSGMPEVSMRFAALMRDYKVQETILTLLTRQYEVAKIEEAKNSAGIEVLDVAAPADRKIRPKRAIIVLAVTFLAFIFGCALALFREYLVTMPADDRHQWEEIKTSLKWKKSDDHV